MNIILQALYTKLRFPSSKGSLNLEQLMELPIESKFPNKTTLRSIATKVAEKLAPRTSDNLSFFNTSSPEDPIARLQLDVIEEIVKMKQEKNKAKLEETNKKDRIKVLKELKAAKLNEADSQRSLEDIEKELQELQG